MHQMHPQKHLNHVQCMQAFHLSPNIWFLVSFWVMLSPPKLGHSQIPYHLPVLLVAFVGLLLSGNIVSCFGCIFQSLVSLYVQPALHLSNYLRIFCCTASPAQSSLQYSLCNQVTHLTMAVPAFHCVLVVMMKAALPWLCWWC